MNPWLAALAYSALFFSLFAGLAFWRHRSRKTRAPFPENTRLLRGPGETLRRRLADLDERSTLEALVMLGLPLLAAAALGAIVTQLPASAQLVALPLAVLAVLGVLYFAARRLVAGIDQWRNVYLGCFGERIVGEALEPLKAQGCRVFHDVPCADGKTTFNIDHVVVGPSGIFAIETKTRRKQHQRPREGVAADKIIFDGQVLAFPWGEDRHGLEQAARQARWLEDSLAVLLGRRTPVQPILTFPGWFIIRRATGTVAVLNPKEISAAVAPRGAPALAAAEIDLIARQLDARCRDVEF